jgi:DNA-binding CsgD family transcriptional regulator
MLTRRRTAAVDGDFAHPDRAAADHRATRVQRVLALLCIIAAGAAFAAEVLVGDDAATFSAMAVVPVLAASLLRSRPLTLIIAAFSMLLQVWGVGVGVVSRNAAGMQIAVYLLTLTVAALQQSRSPLRYLEDLHAHPQARRKTAPRPVIQVTGVEVSAGARSSAPLPAVVADALTRRECDVVLLAAQGYTAREIGVRLFIGDRTVETHLANAYGKLGVRSKVDLARLVTACADHHTDLRTRTEAPERVTA